VRDRQGICVDDISIKKCNICNVCEIESWIYIEGAIHEKRVEVSSGGGDLINYRGTMAGICVEEERGLPHVLRRSICLMY